MTFFFAMVLSTLSLQEAENIALKSNASIQLSEQDVEQKNAQRLQSILSWLPDITFGSMVAKLQKSQEISSRQRQTHLFSNQFVLNQPIFSPSLLGDMRLSTLALEGAKAAYEMTSNDTLFQVRTLYLTVLGKQKTIDVEKQIISYLTTAFGDEQKKFEMGSGTTLQVSQAKTTLSQEITKYYNVKTELSNAQRDLALALHLQEAPPLNNTIDLEDYPLLIEKLSILKTSVDRFTIDQPLVLFSPTEVDEWVNRARQNRPELKRSSLFVQAAQEKSNQAKTQYLPTISAFVDYGYYQPINGEFFRQRNDFAGGIQLSWSLFDSFKREMKTREISAVRKAAGIAYQYESDRVGMTVRQDLHQLEQALFAYLTAAENKELAKQAFEETSVRQSAGRITELEFQNCSRLLSEAMLQADLAEYNLLGTYFQLLHDTAIIK